DITGQVIRVVGGNIWVLQSWTSIGPISKKGFLTPEEIGPKLRELIAKLPPREEMMHILMKLQ
ncbi:MAG: hypothetical protein QW566_10170, partial [Candidatus Jordarchaeales archaeon]